MSRKRHIDVVTMGCSKNLVDSEQLMRRFERMGYTVSHNPENLQGDVVVVNTCGFIGDAKEESIEMILLCCAAKARGEVERVYVMGCLSERYANDLPAEIPEVDGWYGKFDWDGIVDAVTGGDVSADEAGAPEKPWERVITTPRHYAYIKIAEGCNRHCAFCAIPIITGWQKSRTIEDITDEVKALVAEGVKEFNIIAQELTGYGIDIYGKRAIAPLVDVIAQVPGVRWIRLHYAYPSQFPDELLDVMARHANVCRYLDIALQHVSDNVLANMHRHITGDETRALLKRIRETVPGIHIRTTLMVGFPGEGDKEFKELIDFVVEQRFERMGAFAYCEEEDTFAAKNYADTIPEEEKRHRLDKLMAAQEKIAAEISMAKIGTVQTVVIDSETDDYYIGRTQYDSPEVDPEVLVKKTAELTVGEFYDVRIVDAETFDLIAEPII